MIKRFINLAKNEKIQYLISEMVLRGSTFLLSLYYAHVLVSSQFGQLNVYDSLFKMIVIIISFSLPSTVLRFQEISIKSLNAHFMSIYLSISIILLALYPVIKMVFGFDLINNFLIYLLIVSNALLVVLQNTIMIEIVRIKKSLYYLLVSIFISASWIIVSIVVIETGSLVKIISSSIVNIVFFFVIIKYIDFNFYNEKTSYKELISYSLPLVAHSFFSMFLIYSDKLLISYYYGNYEVGQYSFAYLFAMGLNILIIAFNKTWIPNVFDALEKNKLIELNKLVEKQFIIFNMISILLLLISYDFFAFYKSGEYSMAQNVVNIIIISYNIHFIYNIYMPFNLYYKRNRIVSLISFFSALSNIILNIILFNYFSYFIAAITTMISYIFLFYGNYLAANYKSNKLSFKVFINPFIIYLIILNLVLYFKNDLGFRIFSGTIAIIVFFLYIKKKRFWLNEN